MLNDSSQKEEAETILCDLRFRLKTDVQLKSTENCIVSKTLVSLGLCKTEKTPQQYEIQIFDSVTPIKDDWDKLIPPNHSLSSSCYNIYEQASPENINYRFALVTENDVPILGAIFQVIRIRPENLRGTHKNKFTKHVTELMLNLHEILVLVNGNVYKDGLEGLYFDRTKLAPNQANELLNNCIDMIDKKDCLSAVMLKDFPSDLIPPSIPKSIKLDEDISMKFVLNPDWNSLQDYISSLSKKYMARAKKILLSGYEMTVKEFSSADIEANKTEIHALYNQVVSRQSFTFGHLNENYFPAVKTYLGAKLTLKGLYINEKLVGFYSTIDHDSELEVHYVGIDYDYNQSHNLYFNIHFWALEDAILKRKKTLEMGRTTLEAKAILGCKPHYNNTYLIFKNSFSEYCFGYFKKNLSESDSWKTRNPLKTVSSEQLAVVSA